VVSGGPPDQRSDAPGSTEDSEATVLTVGDNRVELRHGSATHVGMVREVNEDSFLAAPPVFVVADGMGGHDGGDIASRIVIDEFARLAESGYDARQAPQAVLVFLHRCRQRLLEYSATHVGSDGGRWYGGTTAVVALLAEDDEGPRWLLANLGDSRVYRVADGRLERVSTDHSVVQELLDSGMITEAEAAMHPERHIVTRALGGPEPAVPDFFDFAMAEAQRILLCSDGITGLLADATVEEVLAGHADPRAAAEQLVAAALSAGGDDNATAVVVDVVGWTPDHTRGAEHRQQPVDEKLGALP
jgi:PPM family protein phosphatase